MQINAIGSTDTGYATNISIVSGETVNLNLVVSSGGSPVNLTGYALKMQINFPTPLYLSNTMGGIGIISAVNGEVQITITSSQSDVIDCGVFDYDFWMENGGVETLLLKGKFAVIPNVTPV